MGGERLVNEQEYNDTEGAHSATRSAASRRRTLPLRVVAYGIYISIYLSEGARGGGLTMKCVEVGRYGGVVVWWCGGVEVWWCGGVAVVRCGGVTVWRWGGGAVR